MRPGRSSENGRRSCYCCAQAILQRECRSIGSAVETTRNSERDEKKSVETVASDGNRILQGKRLYSRALVFSKIELLLQEEKQGTAGIDPDEKVANQVKK